MTRNPQLVVTMAAPEIVPFAKTGGLADVVGALSGALAGAGVRVNMVLPAYRAILRDHIAGRRSCHTFQVDVCGRMVTGRLYRKRLSPLLTVYFVRADEYFDRECFYGTAAGDYPDNAERFAFFSRAALEVARLNHSRVLHLHDWETAPAAAFLKLQPDRYPELSQTKTVLTVHNLAYQGLFNHDHWPALDLDPGYFNPCQFEFYWMINYLKSGLIDADRVTTVSPTYACEIQQDGCGFGLDGVLRERSKDLSGILNGVDYGVWNPETDTFLAERYSNETLAGKAACKAALQQSYGLDVNPGVPLLCMVTRMVDGKGLELVMEIIECLLDDGVQFAILGSGDRRYEEFFCALAARHPGKAGMRIAFDEAAAHQTIAGADIFLMPSRHEPCGLTQMYALKYGTVPIVRRTGGLADSIKPYDAGTGTGDGFVFQNYSGAALLDTIRQALAVYTHKSEWKDLIRRGMAADHSWHRSMQAYLRLYRELVSDLKPQAQPLFD